jgi:hypothetical protein
MTPRSIRRAAERRANKLARKAAQQNMAAAEIQLSAKELQTDDSETDGPETIADEPTIIPAAEANANLSAVTSTLTGHVALIPSADAAPYAQLLRDYQNEFQPVGLQESHLVETLAETIWRTSRLRALETGIFAKGRIEFAKQFSEHKPELRDSLIDVHTFLTYEKQLRGLQLQEARLSRRAEKASAELRALQQERHQREAVARRQQQEPAEQHQPQAAPAFNANGFVFSNREIESQPPYGATPPVIQTCTEAA